MTIKLLKTENERLLYRQIDHEDNLWSEFLQLDYFLQYSPQARPLNKFWELWGFQGPSALGPYWVARSIVCPTHHDLDEQFAIRDTQRHFVYESSISIEISANCWSAVLAQIGPIYEKNKDKELSGTYRILFDPTVIIEGAASQLTPMKIQIFRYI